METKRLQVEIFGKPVSVVRAEDYDAVVEKLAAFERPCEDVDAMAKPAYSPTWTPTSQSVVSATFARRLAAQLRAKTEELAAVNERLAKLEGK